ncbi:hypothetical protein D7Z54_17375 [Salibacterium salarium]|uniref:Uncharacterized protein n=1 Tax=Salibacterium salarium TaxID=284579 RepID=A0A3R9WRD1_9BACI|nr:hypothetical protein D7Z54_17375 [Salibacterium salarium]
MSGWDACASIKNVRDSRGNQRFGIILRGNIARNDVFFQPIATGINGRTALPPRTKSYNYTFPSYPIKKGMYQKSTNSHKGLR